MEEISNDFLGWDILEVLEFIVFLEFFQLNNTHVHVPGFPPCRGRTPSPLSPLVFFPCCPGTNLNPYYESETHSKMVNICKIIKK